MPDNFSSPALPFNTRLISLAATACASDWICTAPHNQVNALLKGTYGLKVVLYPVNAKPDVIHHKLTWSANWRASVNHIRSEISMAQTKSFR